MALNIPIVFHPTSFFLRLPNMGTVYSYDFAANDGMFLREVPRGGVQNHPGGLVNQNNLEVAFTKAADNNGQVSPFDYQMFPLYVAVKITSTVEHFVGTLIALLSLGRSADTAYDPEAQNETTWQFSYTLGATSGMIPPGAIDFRDALKIGVQLAIIPVEEFENPPADMNEFFTSDGLHVLPEVTRMGEAAQRVAQQEFALAGGAALNAQVNETVMYRLRYEPEISERGVFTAEGHRYALTGYTVDADRRFMAIEGTRAIRRRLT